MDLDKVSVIVPSYNRENTIKSCISSIQEQTYKNTEIIVVDDGSSDNTKNIINELIETDQRIILLSLDCNEGAQSARNYGIRKATGKWIAFLDSDDEWIKDSLEKRLALINKEGTDAVYSDCFILRDNIRLKKSVIMPENGNIYRQILCNPGILFQTLLVKKTAFEKISYLDTRINSYQEWDTCIRLAKICSFSYLPEPTFIYNCRNNKTISSDLLLTANGYKKIVFKHFFSILSSGGISALDNHFKRITRQYKRAGVPYLSSLYRFYSGLLSLRFCFRIKYRQ